MANDLERACARNLALERQAQEQGRLIRESADRELENIQRELDSIPPGQTLIDANAATRYSDLIAQRAQLLAEL